jgi:zinc protease
MSARSFSWRITRRMVLALVAVSTSLFAISTQAAASNDGIKTPPYERVQLANGTALLLMERHDVPLLSFVAMVRGGALSDPQQHLGTSSVLAGMLEKGAGSRNSMQFAQAVAAVGGSIETGASTESISVSGSFLARDANLMVELLADMLQRPKLQADEFEALPRIRIWRRWCPPTE